MLSALQESLAKNPNFSWVCPAEVVEVKYLTDCAEIEVKQNGETRTIRTKLLVAADGSRSRIRTEANISTRGWKYWQSCVAITIKAEKPHNDIAFERFSPAADGSLTITWQPLSSSLDSTPRGSKSFATNG